MTTRRRLSALLALVLAGSVLSGLSVAPRTLAAAADCPAYLTQTQVPDGGEGHQSNDGLRAVDAVGYNDVWAVGQRPSRGALIDHWDGDSWTVSLAGEPGGALFAVSFDSATDGWAGGWEAPAEGEPGPLVEHWTGSSWTDVAEPDELNGYVAFGVAALSPTDVWALVSDLSNSIITEAEHWDGHKWTVYPLRAADSWYPGGMTAISSTNVWAVGFTRDTELPLAWHWNGHTWSGATLPLPDGATNGQLTSVSSLSPTDVWAAGATTLPTQAPLVEHWDGNEWTPTETPSPPGREPDLLSISMVSGTNGWAAGWGRIKNSSAVHSFVQHWDGALWSLLGMPTTGKGTLLPGISALPAAGPWVVGSQRRGVFKNDLALHACPNQVRDAGFVPADNQSALGNEMEWSFPLRNKTAHRVEDGSGLGLFSSPPEAPGQVFLYDYIEAGTYAVRDPSTGHAATVSVPMTASPHSGDTGTKFTITWASQTAAQGYVFDVQIERLGSKWRNWFTGLFSTTHATFRTSHSGTYRFRARYRSTASGATSDWSDSLAVVVG